VQCELDEMDKKVRQEREAIDLVMRRERKKMDSKLKKYP
jgi:hypothetical protein